MRITELVSIVHENAVSKKDFDKYGWESNPYVYVIEFERVEVNG